MLWFWPLVLPAILLAAASFAGERKRFRYIREQLAHPPEGPFPPATVIVPVKGEDEGLAENLTTLASLDYPDYELIVTARSRADIPAGVVPERARVVLAGDGDPETGEKINNLLAAIAAARPESEILAFADSDGRVRPGWLRALVAALRQPGAGAATGYRWHIPARPGFWALLRSGWNAVIAGGFGPGRNRFAWGGAMALHRETFDKARVPEFWRGAISDDYGLTAAIGRAGLGIAFAPGAMVASRDHTGAKEFLGWITRQMIITRIYNRRLWLLAFIAHCLYCAAMIACLSAGLSGAAAGWWALAWILGAGIWKGRNRAALARRLFPEDALWFRRHGWIYAWWTPLITWVWLYGLLASALTDSVEWRGYRYRLKRPTVPPLPPA
ncbi:MAG: glycosyltransferase [Bryobacteraceae bacterium]